jgi:hypothetical protein
VLLSAPEASRLLTAFASVLADAAGADAGDEGEAEVVGDTVDPADTGVVGAAR